MNCNRLSESVTVSLDKLQSDRHHSLTRGRHGQGSGFLTAQLAALALNPPESQVPSPKFQVQSNKDHRFQYYSHHPMEVDLKVHSLFLFPFLVKRLCTFAHSSLQVHLRCVSPCHCVTTPHPLKEIGPRITNRRPRTNRQTPNSSFTLPTPTPYPMLIHHRYISQIMRNPPPTRPIQIRIRRTSI